MNRFVALAAAAAVAGGCADSNIVDVPSQPSGLVRAQMPDHPGNPGLTVMTWNVYYGTDPKIVLGGSVDDIPFLAAQAGALAAHNDFPARAGALARAIAAQQPHLVGLQELGLWRSQHPSDFVAGNFAPNADNVAFDYLQILIDSLEQRGLHYNVAAVDTTSDLEVPVFTGVDPSGNPTFDDVRLTDRDAVLVRADVLYSDAQSVVYNADVQIPLSQFLTIHVREGWSSVVASLSNGVNLRFVSTHLEIQEFQPVGELQAQELLDALEDDPLPTILVGDFNSDVYGRDPSKATPVYGIITGAGFTDLWAKPSRSAPGLTCCQNDSLSNRLSNFDQRVDFIFARNMPQVSPAGTLVLARSVVGDQRGDRTPSGLWPSDHGGIVATLLMPPVGPRTVAE